METQTSHLSTSFSISHQEDPSSFQSSSTGFSYDVGSGNSSAQSHVMNQLTLTGSGYQTPNENRVHHHVCGSCDKVFHIKKTFVRHSKSCNFKKQLRKRKLNFKNPKRKRKTDLFAEYSSTSSEGDGETQTDFHDGDADDTTGVFTILLY